MKGPGEAKTSCRCNEVKDSEMRSSWILRGGALNLITSVLIRDKRGHTRHRKRRRQFDYGGGRVGERLPKRPADTLI